MNVYYDLHIHSALSPCANNDMTPNNIVNMAKLKGLDVIAITDHHAIANVYTTQTVAQSHQLICISGIEIETKEGIHVLAYFSQFKQLERFYTMFTTFLPAKTNQPDFFGQQLIFDQFDQQFAHDTRLLLGPSQITLNDLLTLIDKYKGVAVLAHINRSSQSVFSQLGFIPPEILPIGLEIDESMNLPPPLQTKNWSYFKNSDAHGLGQIKEKKHYLKVASATKVAIFQAIRRKKCGQ